MKVNGATGFITLLCRGWRGLLTAGCCRRVIKDVKSHWNVCFLFEQMTPYMSQPSHPAARTRHKRPGSPAAFWQSCSCSWRCFWHYSTVSSRHLSWKTSGSWNTRDPPNCSSQEGTCYWFLADVRFFFFVSFPPAWFLSNNLGLLGAKLVTALLRPAPSPALVLDFSHPFQIKWTPDENAKLSVVGLHPLCVLLQNSPL